MKPDRIKKYPHIPLSAWLKENKCKPQEFAEMIGVSGSYLYLVLRLERTLSTEKLKRVHEITGIPTDYLLYPNK